MMCSINAGVPAQNCCPAGPCCAFQQTVPLAQEKGKEQGTERAEMLSPALPSGSVLGRLLPAAELWFSALEWRQAVQ